MAQLSFLDPEFNDKYNSMLIAFSVAHQRFS